MNNKNSADTKTSLILNICPVPLKISRHFSLRLNGRKINASSLLNFPSVELELIELDWSPLDLMRMDWSALDLN